MTQRTKPYDAQLAAWLIGPLTKGPITPNHLTALRLLTGMAGAFIFAVCEAPNLGAWLIVLSNFLDHTDGELARLSGRQSRLGYSVAAGAGARYRLARVLWHHRGAGCRGVAGGGRTSGASGRLRD